MNRHLSLFASLTAFLFIVVNLTIDQAQATPWLSNRYAQNCAGCHAPGRLNLPAKERRCTLSCQGCHVNPNGGGLRNQYGIWNQQRWLRSFSTKGLLRGEKPTPLPDFQQKYVPGNKLSKKKKRKKRRKKRKKKKKKKKKKATAFIDDYDKAVKKDAPTMRATRRLDHNESKYDYATYTDWNVDAKSWSDFLSRVPEGDPWRLERSQMFTVSGDMRYLYGTFDGEVGGQDISDDLKTMSSLMVVDLGIRYRPVGETVSLVFEPRFSNGPFSGDIESGFTSNAQVRSAYVIADMLPWNTWGMFGLYKPMFGFHQADHNAFAQRISGMGQNATFKALGIGGSPNVPFVNAHMIIPTTTADLNANTQGASAGAPSSKDEGFNLNLGGRFVTRSLSGKLSYWSTNNEEKQRKRTMISASAAGMFGPVIANIEYLWAEDDWEEGALSAGSIPTKHSGSVATVDLKVRFWRENYLVLNNAISDVALDLTEGNGTESMVGIKSFLTSGLELELLFINRKEIKTNAGVDTTNFDTKLMQFQAHYFF